MWLNHTRALKVLGTDLYPAYLTTILQTKLDQNTMYKWKKHSKDHVKKIPPVEELIKFIDFQARTLEGSTIRKMTVTPRDNSPVPNKQFMTNKVTTHFSDTTDGGSSQCNSLLH